MLTIDFTGQDGAYQVTILDSAGKTCYSQTFEVNNLKTIDLNLASYVEGTYTIITENENELYKASFTLPFDANNIGDIVISQSANSNPIYDLSGRHVSVSSTLAKGIYIQQGKKLMVRP